MVGGLLNLLFQSNEDTILIGNVDKSFFKKTFVAHNNFGKQKFRIDFEGSTKLNYTSPTIYNFNIPSCYLFTYIKYTRDDKSKKEGPN